LENLLSLEAVNLTVTDGGEQEDGDDRGGGGGCDREKTGVSARSRQFGLKIRRG